MKRIPLLLVLLFLSIGLNSCSGDVVEQYTNINDDSAFDKNGSNGPQAPIRLNLAQVPLPKLSDYRFFIGELKNQTPGYKVLPYKPASELFSDYAHKKRFIWMPNGVSATYDGDDNVFIFPVGTVMIKTFFYNNVQPLNATRIIETRLLIKTAEATLTDSGWKLYDYIWNEAQTEAFLDTEGNGVFVPITFTENDVTRSITYKIPAATECATCHKINPNQTGEIVIPIGPKPQNLNTNYNYGLSTRNQLSKWKAFGYINNSLPPISSIYSTINYTDTSQPLELRARSYIDINCAHCHRLGGHCDYVPQRFNFSNIDSATFGLCMVPSAQIDNGPFVINGGNAEQSELFIRMNSTEESVMMPLIGRTVNHDEGIQLMRDWIDSLPQICD